MVEADKETRRNKGPRIYRMAGFLVSDHPAYPVILSIRVLFGSTMFLSSVSKGLVFSEKTSSLV